MIVRWTRKAQIDLRGIEKHIAIDSPTLAKAMSKKIASKTKILADHPLFGAAVDVYDVDRIRELLVVPYRILYKVNECDGYCEVLAIFHAAQLLPDLLDTSSG